MKITRFYFRLLLLGILSVGGLNILACNGTPTPPASPPSPSPTATATTTATPDPFNVSKVSVPPVHPKAGQVASEVIEIDNCGGTGTMEVSLSAQTAYENNITFGAAVKLGAEEELALPGVVKAKLSQEINATYQQAVQRAQNRTDSIKYNVAHHSHVNYRFEWRSSVYAATAQYQQSDVVYSVPYTFTIYVPRPAGSVEVICPPTPTSTPTPSPTTTPPAAPVDTDTPTPSPTATVTPSPSATPTPPSPTVPPTATSTPTATAIPPPTRARQPLSALVTGKISAPVFDGKMYNTYVAEAVNDWVPELKFRRVSQASFSDDGQGMVLRSWNHQDWAQNLVYLPDYSDLRNYRFMTRTIEDGHPQLSANREIVYHRRSPNRPPVIMKIGTHFGAENNPRNQQELAEGENPDWLGQQIIFYGTSPQSGLYIMDNNGGNKQLVLEVSEKLIPAASPDGDKIAVSFNLAAGWQIYTLTLTGNGWRLDAPSKTTEGNNHWPVWSHDGQYIAFVSDREGSWAVWVMREDGSGQEKLFDLPGSIHGTIDVSDIDSKWSIGRYEEQLSWAP